MACIPSQSVSYYKKVLIRKMNSKEISYIVDEPLSKKLKILVISLKGCEALQKEKLLQFFQGNEQKLISALIQEEESYLEKEGKKHAKLPFSSFRIRPSSSYQILQMLGAIGKLYTKEGKRLVVDSFSRLSATFDATSQNDTIECKAILHDAACTWDVKSCALFLRGSPHIVIKDMFIKHLHEDISFDDIAPFFERTSVQFTLSEWKKWKKEQEDESPAKKFSETKASSCSIEKSDPLPVLKLCDAHGALANLFMDYGKGTLFPFGNLSCEIERNQSAEKSWEKDLVECGYSRKTVGDANYYCPADKVVDALDFLLDIGWTVFDAQGKKIKRLSSLNLDFIEKENAYRVDGKILFNEEELDLSLLLHSVQKKKAYIQLSSTTVGLLPKKELLPALSSLAKEIVIQGNEIVVRKSSVGLLDDILSFHKENFHIQRKDLPVQKEEINFSNFLGTLRPYQREGVEWISSLYSKGFSGILADDMGLGKTVQVLAFLASRSPSFSSLIVVPTSLVFNWKREIETFFPSSTL